MQSEEQPPICDYEGSDYQTVFWDRGGRTYEDRVEAVALRRLLPSTGELLLELGAGAGRNTARYQGFERVVLLDYSLSQLNQAQERLGASDRYIYVAADIYRLPFVDGLFNAATMIRVLHHMADPLRALRGIRRVLQPGEIFILEFANKQNLKAILRYLLGRQDWNPFTLESVEFVPMNYDFHPQAVRAWLHEVGFAVERQLTVSHFRLAWLKRVVPVGLLVALDSLAQWTGAWWQLTPSVFLRAKAVGDTSVSKPEEFFRCPTCEHAHLEKNLNELGCSNCSSKWPIRNRVYDFRTTSN